MTELETTTNRPSTIPFLPPDIVELIVSYLIEPYSLKITYSWFNFERRVQIYNIPQVEPLQLVSHAFNNAVKRQIRLLFTGRIVVDYDAILRIHRHCKDDSNLVEWLFDHASSIVITDYYKHLPIEKHELNLKCWPALRWLALCITRSYSGRSDLICDDLEVFDELVWPKHPEFVKRLDRNHLTSRKFMMIVRALRSLRLGAKSPMLRTILELKYYPTPVFAERTDKRTIYLLRQKR